MKTVSLAAGLLLLCAVSIAAAERVSLKNEYIEVLVERETGRFTIRSTGGSPFTEADDNRFLLYDATPSTSYTTIALDGGSDVYQFGSDDGKFVTRPVLTNDSVVAVWRRDDCEVTQILTLVKSPASEVADSASIAYRVRNLSSRRLTVGIRILLDPSLGDVDGIPYQVPGHGLVDSEYEFRDASVPQYWYSYDDLKNPRVRAMGTLRGPGVIPPDRIVFAAWRRLSRNPWRFLTEQGESFRQSLFGSRDSAVALFYDSRPVEPAGSWTIATLYGMYGVQQFKGNIWSMVLGGSSSGDDRLPFGMTADIQNVGPSVLSNCRLSISMPSNFSIVQGVPGAATNQAIVFPRLARNASQQVRWNLQAERGSKGSFEFFVTVSGMAGVQLHTASMKRQITIQPASSDELRSLSTNFFGPLVIEVPKTNPRPVVLTNPVYRPLVRSVTNIVAGRPVVEVFTVLRRATVRTNIISRIVDLPDLDIALPVVWTNQTRPGSERQAIQTDWKPGMRSRIASAIGRADSLLALMVLDERRRVDRMIDEALVALARPDAVATDVGRMVADLERFLDGIAVRGAGR